MGQSQDHNCVHPPQDLFLQELRVYQWRADSNFNIFIPRVYFRSAFAQLQQQKFTKFIEQQSSKQYFEISKFRQQLQQTPKNIDDQVIVFQNYVCTLKQLEGKLAFQQALYALQALLAGFEEIKKVYQTIIIDPACCFVTLQGSIRAWINPNAKSNRVWQDREGETARHNIIDKIVKMMEQSTQISKNSQDFFKALFINIAHRQLNSSYSELRRWINEYCFTHNIIMAKKIVLSNKKHEERKCAKNYQRHSRKTEISERQECYKENNALFLSTQESQNIRPFQRILSLQKNIGLTFSVFQIKNSNLPQPLRPMNIAPHFQLQNSTSQLIIRTNLAPPPVKFSTVTQPTEQPTILKENALINSPQKQRLMGDRDMLQVRSNNNLLMTSNKSLQSEKMKLNEKPIEVASNKKPSIRKQVAKNQKPREDKKSMQVSITQNMIETNRKENRHKTLAEKEFSQRQSDTESIHYSRPWITTKTITRLISDNQQKYSLKNSIAESSDYYNGSVYSGVLTQMGREVGKPINLGRSKTLGVSQQL